MAAGPSNSSVKRVVLLLVVLLAGCRHGSGQQQFFASEVEGMVVSGPHCPVERAESPCPDLPVAGAEVVALDGRGDVVGTDIADDDGRYGILLPPGRYTVTVRGLGGIQSASSVEAVVRPGAVTTVSILVDTGIR